MQFFILLPHDTQQDAHLETNLLGEYNGFKSFYIGMGFHVLHRIINESSDYAEKIRIIDERARKYSIEEFLNFLEGKKIISDPLKR